MFLPITLKVLSKGKGRVYVSQVTLLPLLPSATAISVTHEIVLLSKNLCLYLILQQSFTGQREAEFSMQAQYPQEKYIICPTTTARLYSLDHLCSWYDNTKENKISIRTSVYLGIYHMPKAHQEFAYWFLVISSRCQKKKKMVKETREQKGNWLKSHELKVQGKPQSCMSCYFSRYSFSKGNSTVVYSGQLLCGTFSSLVFLSCY